MFFDYYPNITLITLIICKEKIKNTPETGSQQPAVVERG